MPSTGDWINTSATGSLWSTAANWHNSSIPNAANAFANFLLTNTSATAGTRLIDLGGLSRTVGFLNIGSDATRNWNLSNGTLVLSSGGTAFVGIDSAVASTNTISAAVQLASNTTFAINSDPNATLLITGAISESGGARVLQKFGTGSLTLTGTNSWTGGTTINAGTVKVGDTANNGSLGTGAVSIVTGASLIMDGNNTFAVNGLSNDLSGAGSLTFNNNLSHSISGANAGFSGTIILNAGGLTVSGANQLGTGQVTLNGSSALLMNNAVALTLDNLITGSGALSKFGAGTLTLTNENSNWAGTTNISAGTLKASGFNRFSETSAVNISTGATLDMGGNSQSIGALNGSGTVMSSGPGVFNLTQTNASFASFSGILSGAASGFNFIKNGVGSLVLSGANTYTGSTTINSGTLILGHGNAISFGDLTVNGTLDFNGFVGSTGIKSIGSLSGSGLITNGGSDAFTTTLSTFNNTGFDTTFSGVIENGTGGDTLALQKTGNGKLTLTGIHTYTGQTSITAGTLALTSSGSVSNAFIVIGAGAALDLTGATTGVFVKDLLGSGLSGAVLLGSQTLTVTQAGISAASPVFTGNAAINRVVFNLDSATTNLNMSFAGTFTSWTSGTDTITVNGNSLANIITGSSNAESLSGAAGNDTILGGAGADTLNGGADNDTVDFSTATTLVLIHLDGMQYAQWGSGAGGAIEQDTLIAIENAIGGSGADSIYGSTLANTIDGRDGIDFISAGDGNDTIDGGSGRDFIDGSYDNDFIVGGDEVGAGDTIYGGAHNDTILGGDGNDFLYGNHGNDSINGGNGTDVLFVDSTDGFYNGDAGIDYIVWQDSVVAANLDVTAHSADYFYGFSGADVVTAIGAATRAELHGAAGNDTLSGSAGVGSILLGEANDDRLIGNTGIDHMVGGTGADRFVIAAGGGTDYVYDFSSASTDKVQFSSIPGIASFANLTINTTYSAGGWYGYGYGSGTVWVNTTAAGGAALVAGDFLFV